MTKRINKGARILLGGVDVSDITTRWQVGAATGELYEAQIDLLDLPSRIKTIRPPNSFNRPSKNPQTASGGAEVIHRLRVATDDTILVGGVDISKWITGYERVSSVGKADVVRLHVQCDTDVLSINGAHPWEDVL